MIIDCINKTAPTVNEPTPFKMIRTSNVKNGWITLDDVKYVSEDIYHKWTRRAVPQKGDIILTREAPLGEVGMVRSDDRIFLGQRLVQYRANPEILDNNFLLYSFLGRDLQEQIMALGSGATVAHMRVPDAEKLTIPLPPINIQRKIADRLSVIDNLIGNNTRRIAILEEMARLLYREWFVNFRFPGHEEVKMVDSPLGPIPEGWEVGRLGDFADEVRSSVSPEQVDPEMPYLGLEHFPRRSIALSEWGMAKNVQSTKLMFKKGEILFGKIRPYFHKVGVAPIDGVCSTDAIVIVPKKEDLFSLVLCTVASDEFVAYATQTSQGTKMPRANWPVLADYRVIMPNDIILKRFNALIGEMVALIQNLIFKTRNLRTTRDLLLPRLISGEIDVSNLDNATIADAGLDQ